jgi:NAD(P)-dependent dehydrogenase (short-subunit alcohol dehydrogenase family)
VSALAGQVALVTGASRGIGAAVATALRDAGARVVRVARSLERGAHHGFDDLPCDISDPAAVTRMADEVLTATGTPDVVVNSAGVFDRIPFEQTSVAELQRMIAVNLVGQFAVARAFLPAMHRRGTGLLVNVGSVADHRAFPENTIYSSTKFGLRGLHETLALEYRGSGVRCTLISPGPTDTPIWDAVDPDNRRGTVPRHAMLQPADVAEAVVFIATRPPRVHIEWLRILPAA